LLKKREWGGTLKMFYKGVEGMGFEGSNTEHAEKKPVG